LLGRGVWSLKQVQKIVHQIELILGLQRKFAEEVINECNIVFCKVKKKDRHHRKQQMFLSFLNRQRNHFSQV
jgi:hypothetical protein